ncbi:MAG: hypothetical protein U1F66_03865 [bacterium]
MENNLNTSTRGIRNLEAFAPVAAKSLQAQQAASQGPAAANADLVQWYEQAYAYYNAVLAGDPNTPHPSAEAWNSFLQQMNWAAAQLGYGQPQAWDPTAAAMQGGAPMAGHSQLGLPQGASLGTMDNIVWTNEKAEIRFDGQSATHDIWSNDVAVTVDSLSAHVTSEITTDTRLNPPEEVLKIIVKDPATGGESVYFVHDYEDAKVKVQTSEQSQLEDASGRTEWEKFDPTAKAKTSKPEASIEGEVRADGAIVYEPEFSGETVDFFAQGGKDQEHIVYADANITVRPSDKVEVHQGSNEMILVMVKHRDGSIDYYEVQKGYKVNVNANAEYISILGKKTAEVPESLTDRVTINGKTSQIEETTSETGIDADSIVQNLIDTAGLNSPEQLMNALKSAGYDFEKIEDFKKALKDGSFPGALADPKFGEFLYILDKEIQTAWQKPGIDGQGVTNRIAELIQILMPNEIVSALSDTKEGYEGSFSVTGKRYNWHVYGNRHIDVLAEAADTE